MLIRTLPKSLTNDIWKLWCTWYARGVTRRSRVNPVYLPSTNHKPRKACQSTLAQYPWGTPLWFGQFEERLKKCGLWHMPYTFRGLWLVEDEQPFKEKFLASVTHEYWTRVLSQAFLGPWLVEGRYTHGVTRLRLITRRVYHVHHSSL